MVPRSGTDPGGMVGADMAASRAGIIIVVLIIVAVLAGMIVLFLELAPMLNDWVNRE